MQEMKRRARILTIGEVLDMDWENGTRRLAAMVNNNMLHSQLQYALYGASARVFLGPDGTHTHETLNTTVLAVSAAAVCIIMSQLCCRSALGCVCALLHVTLLGCSRLLPSGGTLLTEMVIIV